MKKNALLVLMLLTALSVKAQYFIPSGRDIASKKAVGSYNLLVTYNFTYIRDTVNKRRKTDIERLETGKGVSRYYSILAEQKDSSFCSTLVATNGKSSGSGMFFYDGQPERYEDFYLNYPEKGVLTCRTELFNTDYEYSEPIPEFSWTFKDSTEEVLGYKCRIAETTFRGRSYVVYFTEDIPVKSGPWKFNGLPGLIMKVTDDKGWFIWEATGISQEIGNIFIYDPAYGKTKGHEILYLKKTNRKQLRTLQKMEWDNPIGLSQMYGVHTYKYYPPTFEKEDVRKEDYASFRTPYIPPLELE
jgi:GLPGLI family protein